MSEDVMKVSVKQMVENFKFKQVCGDEESLDNRFVMVSDVNRPGLELTGYPFETNPRRIVIIGEKEQMYLAKLSDDVVYERFEQLTDEQTPFILVTHGNKVPNGLAKKASEKNFPVFVTNAPTYRVVADITVYLDEKLAPVVNIHGVLLSIYGTGVLVTGESGMGKSEVALEMISKGHVIISDDRVDIKKVGEHLMGEAPILLKGFLEIRGIGIINVPRMFGSSKVSDTARIDLVVHFEPFDKNREYTRVGVEVNQYQEILGVPVPKITIPVTAGRSMGTLLESAVSQFKLKEAGYDSAKEFEELVYDFIKSQDVQKGVK